jgi:hypothetical protein
MLVALVAAGSGAIVLARLDLAPPGARSPAAGPRASLIAGSLVHLDQADPSLTFLPLLPGPRGARTWSAQHAYDALLATPTKLNPIPATVQAYYGLLNDASATPAAADLRVWGFAVESGCVYADEVRPHGMWAPTYPARCRHWEFVDARTGHDLGVIEQEVLPR